MTTINRLNAMGITLDVSAETLAELAAYDAFSVSSDEIKAMNKEERDALYNKCNEILDQQKCDDMWSHVYGCYCRLTAIEDEEYREANMEKFREYEARMNEPDFDWSYYSDWHKDMFGYRPHYRVIPVDENARKQLFEAFHAARGF